MSVIQSTINGTSFESLGAMLLNYDIEPCKYTGGYVVPTKSMIPVKIKHQIGTRKISLKIDFIGTSRTDVTNKVAAFIKLLHEGADIKLPDGYYYQCYYSSSSSSKEMAPWIYQVDFTLDGYKHGELITINKTYLDVGDSQTVNITGDIDTPFIFEMTAKTSAFRFFGITFKYPSGITNKKVVMDGYKKTIMLYNDGSITNFFDNCDINAFPVLSVGEQEIELEYEQTTEKKIETSIKYYPLYL